ICDRRGGSKCVVVLVAFVGRRFAGDLLPNDFARTTIDAQHCELKLPAFVSCGLSLILICRDRAEHENPISPNDRGGVAFAGKREFPFNVVGLAPIQRRVGVRSYTRTERAAPLWPKIISGGIGNGLSAQT